MKVSVNGQSQELANPMTVADLLSRFNLHNERVAVECNGQIVPREEYANHALADGDVVEVVRFVGGG